MPSRGLSDPTKPTPPIESRQRSPVIAEIVGQHHEDVGARGPGGHGDALEVDRRAVRTSPAPSAIDASRRGAASPAVNRTTVKGDERPAWPWRNPSSASRNRRVRQARSEPLSRAAPLPRHATHRPPDERRVGREVHLHAAEGKRDHHRPVGRRERSQQPVDRAPEERFASRSRTTPGRRRRRCSGRRPRCRWCRRARAGRAAAPGATGSGAVATRRSERSVLTRPLIRTSTSDWLKIERPACRRPARRRSRRSGPAGRSPAGRVWRAGRAAAAPGGEHHQRRQDGHTCVTARRRHRRAPREREGRWSPTSPTGRVAPARRTMRGPRERRYQLNRNINWPIRPPGS